MSNTPNAFRFKCDGDTAGCFFASSDKVSVTVGQSMLRDGREQMWDSVLVLSRRDDQGLLTTRVLLCNPDWDEPLELAMIQSDSQNNMTIQVAEPKSRSA